MKFLKDIFQTLYPYAIFRTGRGVYLTFDDGPIPEVTSKVLDILAKYNVPATFFMVGENIDKHPDVFHQVIDAGHAFGNHTYNHLKGWITSGMDYARNIEKWNEAVERQGVEVPLLFRPPYGKADLLQRWHLIDLGYHIYYWDVLTRDYDASVTPEQMFEQIKRETRSGSIINFHDSLKSNERMLAVLPQVIEWLQAQGYELRKLT